MRHHSLEITKAQEACVKRHQQLHRDIEHCLKHGRSYPWVLLAQLNADKFFSDIVESVLGGIFADSGENLADCRRFAERIGLLPYLHRIAAEDIDVVHPKNALGCLAGPDRIKYIVERGDNVRGPYRCSTRINDFDFVAVGDCLTKNEAIIRAADATLKLKSQILSIVS